MCFAYHILVLALEMENFRAGPCVCYHGPETHSGFGNDEGRPRMRKQGRVEKGGKTEREQQRRLEGNEQRGGKIERKAAYFVSNKNTPQGLLTSAGSYSPTQPP